MLVTRQCEPEQNHWSISKLETIYPKSSDGSRMSNNFDTPLSTQSDWQGQYAFLPPGDSGLFSQSYDHVGSSSTIDGAEAAHAQPRSAPAPENPLEIDPAVSAVKPDVNAGPLISSTSSSSSPLSHRRSLDPLGLRQQQPKPPSPIQEQPEPQGDQYAHKAAESAREESSSTSQQQLVSTADAVGLGPGGLSSSSLGPSSSASSSSSHHHHNAHGLHLHHQNHNHHNNHNPLGSVASVGQGGEMQHGGTIAIPPEHETHGGGKEEEDMLEDEDMVEGDADGEAAPQPQTAAERTAQRRKMKRFRLTHQQTRFLMSEFAKQPHPDAAHRERLSREIPGLSPRQVQVWFQNRRAKIKRLTADDRDRMIKMRAVPDDFDNVQALHSPYGAVHGLGSTPITSPVDFGAPSYADPMMRPLMVDVRRAEGEDHLSPTGLSPAFGSIGFNPSATLSAPDILSPMSPTSGSDRYPYSSHLSTPLSTGGSGSSGPRTSNPFGRQGSMDSAMPMSSGGGGGGSHSHSHSRQPVRPLQPLQLRETMSRSRSDNLQSPLRSSMSWKGDSIDYTTYHGGHGSPQMGGRQQPVYPQDPIGGTSTPGLGGYDSSTYTGSTVQSPTHMNYPGFQSPTLQQNPQSRSRLRAASASLPLGLDLRNQFRSVSTGHNMQSAAQSPGSRAPSTPQQLAGGGGVGSGVSSSYTASFPSAPLTAPMDFQLPRTPGFRSSGPDYSMSQMSAPIAPPNDFSQAFQASMAGSNNAASRTPMRDTFGGGPDGAGDRTDDFSQDSLGMKRKHSFTGSPPTAVGQNTYGNTA